MDIFVTDNFQQESNDTVIETLPNGVALISAAKAIPYKQWRVQDTDGSLMASVIDTRLNQIVATVSDMLEKAAKHLRYDNIASVRSYAGYANAYQAEATLLAVWASDCWKALEGIEAGIKAGTTPLPTVVDAVALLPTAPVTVAALFKPEPIVKLP